MTRLLIERLLAVDRPQARPTSGRAIAVAAAGGAPVRRPWSLNGWRASWPAPGLYSAWTQT